MRSGLSASGLMLVGLAAACGRGPVTGVVPPLQVDVRTDRTAYQVGDTAAITLTNRGAVAALLPTCDARPGFLVEALQGGSWVESARFNILCPAIYPSGVSALQPGAQLTVRQAMVGAGTLRFGFPAAASPDDPPHDTLRSNVIDVRTP